MTTEERILSLEKKVRFLRRVSETCCSTGAINGLSNDDSENIVLGQDLNQSGNPAAITSDREIPLAGHSLVLTDTGSKSTFYGGSLVLEADNIFSSGIDLTNEIGAGNISINTSDSSKTFDVSVSTGVLSMRMSDNTNDEEFKYEQAGVTLTGNSDSSFQPNLNLVDHNGGNHIGTIQMLQGDFEFNSDYTASIQAPSGIFLDAANDTETSDPIVTIGSGNTVTGANNKPGLFVTSEWNTTGSPTLIKGNATDTASDVSSKLLDLQVGAVSKFAVDKSGKLILDGSLASVTPPASTTPVSWGTINFGGVDYKVALYS